MATAHRVNIVVVILPSVLKPVLENHVNLIPTVAQVNIVVVLMEHAPQNVLENFVPMMATAHHVVVLMEELANVALHVT